METRFQHVFLMTKQFISMRNLLLILLLYSSSDVYCADPTGDNVANRISVNSNVDADKLDSEFFELGVYGGVLNVQDFTSELLLGARATFHASEDFFLQFNYAQANISESSFEKNLGSALSGADRDYSYYDLLLGYNVIQGEAFPVSGRTSWSALYVVAGVGDTEFGAEESFTYVLGAGLRVNLTRRYVWSVDLRDHIYRSSLLRENERTHNVEFSTGISFLF